MTGIGIGAMLYSLRGGSEQSADKYYGRTITSAVMANEQLTITFSDNVTIDIWDDGQSCCEARYMTTDDDVQSLVGCTLTSIEAKVGDNIEDDDGPHEIVFVEITTDKGHIQIVNHNEHNGYYGGFGLTITERKP